VIFVTAYPDGLTGEPPEPAFQSPNPSCRKPQGCQALFLNDAPDPNKRAAGRHESLISLQTLIFAPPSRRILQDCEDNRAAQKR
jgi:hypothetical protein